MALERALREELTQTKQRESKTQERYRLELAELREQITASILLFHGTVGESYSPRITASILLFHETVGESYSPRITASICLVLRNCGRVLLSKESVFPGLYCEYQVLPEVYFDTRSRELKHGPCKQCEQKQQVLSQQETPGVEFETPGNFP